MMTLNKLREVIRYLERLERVHNLTADGYHWLVQLRRELDSRIS